MSKTFALANFIRRALRAGSKYPPGAKGLTRRYDSKPGVYLTYSLLNDELLGFFYGRTFSGKDWAWRVLCDSCRRASSHLACEQSPPCASREATPEALRAHIEAHLPTDDVLQATLWASEWLDYLEKERVQCFDTINEIHEQNREAQIALVASYARPDPPR